MFKMRNKKIVLVMVLVFAFTFVMPLSSYASVDVLTLPTVTDGMVQSMGTVFCDSMAGKSQVGDTAVISLPNDFKFVNSMETKINDPDWVMDFFDWNTISVDGAVYRCVGVGSYSWTDSEGTNHDVDKHELPVDTVENFVRLGNEYNNFYFPVKYNGKVSGNYTKNPMQDGYVLTSGILINPLDENQIKLTVLGLIEDENDPYNLFPYGSDPSRNVYFFLNAKAVYIDEGYEGTIYLSMDAPPGVGFPSGDIPVGEASDGEVTVSVEEDCNIADEGEFTLRFKENINKALVPEDYKSIAIELPDGFSFVGAYEINSIWGSKFTHKPSAGQSTDGSTTGDTTTPLLTDDNNNDPSDSGDVDESAEVPYDFELYGDNNDEIRFYFENYTNEASCFEITFRIQVEDETDVEHGDIEVKLSGSETDLDPETLIVGTYGDYSSDLEVEEPTEVLAGMDGQEIGKLVIKESVAQSMIEDHTLLLTLPDNARWVEDTLGDFDADEGLNLDYQGLIGTDDRTAKFTVKKDSSDDAAEISLEDVEVYLEAGETGDLVVEVGGSAGLDGEVLVANVVAPIIVEASGTPNVKIGASKQVAGDITITEVKADTLIEGEDLIVELPEDVKFAGTPDVEVVEGDLKINDIKVDDEVLTISIEDASSQASTIKISSIYYTLYRTIPEGEIEVSIEGSAVVESCDYNDDDKYDFNTEEAATVVNAICGTPGSSEEKLSTSITLGDNGSYISDGRMMVQLRDAAIALGVTEQNILWDGASNAATLVKGDRVVQITVGDPQVKLNGMPLTTDKGAEIKDGRTYVSLSAAGLALGATAEWDNTTKSAILAIE